MTTERATPDKGTDPYRTAAEMPLYPEPRRPLMPRVKLALAYGILGAALEGIVNLVVCACFNVQSARGAGVSFFVVNALAVTILALRWSFTTIAKDEDGGS